MTTDAAPPDAAPHGGETARPRGRGGPPEGGSASSIRGASILMVGRLSSILVLTGFQLLLARMLDRAEFGAFGYAVSVAAIASTIITLGTVNALPRVLALSTRDDPPGAVPAILVFELALLSTLGLVAFALMRFGQSLVGPTLSDDRLAVTLTSIVILMAPLEAIDRLAETYIAFVGGVRRILFRKYVLGPLLRLSALVALVAGASVEGFAVAFVALNALGTAFYLALVVTEIPLAQLRDLGSAVGRVVRPRVAALVRIGGSVMAHATLHTFFGFGGAIFLGLASTTDQVAVFRAVAPFSQIIHSLSITFAIMIEPQIAREAAGGGRRPGLDRLYWDSALWFSVLAFPLLALVFINPDLMLQLAFGGRYDDGATVLRIVALGYFLYSALGFHAQTILMFDRVRLLVAADVVAGVVLVGTNLALIPDHGAVGAAFALFAGLVTLAVCSLAAVRHLGVGAVPARRRGIYLVMAAGLGSGTAASELMGSSAGLAVTVTASVVVLAVARRSMRLAETVPELLRIPLIGTLLGPPDRPAGESSLGPPAAGEQEGS